MKLYYPLLRLFWNRVEQHNKLRRSSAYKSDSTVLINDIPYFDGGAEHLLDIHLPKDGESAPLPVIVSVHGGGMDVRNEGKQLRVLCKARRMRLLRSSI